MVRLDRRLKTLKYLWGGAYPRPRPPQAPIPVIMIIDVEPDGFFVSRDEPVPWAGYETVHQVFHAFRPLWSAKTGAPVHYSWYFRMDPQVAKVYGSAAWVATYYAKFMDDYVAAGDELGLHTHAYRWDEALDSWVVDHGNQPWIHFCVQTSFTAFYQAFGRQCDSFRFGDRWMNNETIALVESLGARFDLTLEPGQAAALAGFPDKPFTGSLPDYTGVPRAPFQRSERDYRKPDPGRHDGIWMIPLSTVAANDSTVLLRLWNRLVRDERSDCCTLNLALDPTSLVPAIDRALSSSNSPYLVFVIRSDIGANPKLCTNLRKNLAGMIEHPLADRFVFSTPAECMKLLGLI